MRERQRVGRYVVCRALRFATRGPDRCEKLDSVPHRQPEIFRIGAGQLPRRFDVDLLALEGLGVLPEPELLKPAAEVSAHHYPASSSRRAFASLRSLVSKPSVNQL